MNQIIYLVGLVVVVMAILSFIGLAQEIGMVKTPEIHCHHHFEWSVILAASIVACAISAVLTQFGSIIGLSSDNFITDSVAMTHWTVIAVGLWIFPYEN